MAVEKIAVPSFERRKPARRPLPEHLPRERIVYPMPATCPCCGDSRLQDWRGRDRDAGARSAPLEGDPARAREARLPGLRSDRPAAGPLASDCARACRTQAAGPCSVCQVGLHLPLNRQSDVYQREGVDLDVSTLADWVGASAATLMPLVDTIRSHVIAAERIHADDPTVPVLAKGKTRTGPPGAMTRARRSITASAAGMHLAAYLMTDGFACRTMLLSVSYGRSP
ncbi:transposase [Bradyrhizobium sp. USDA 4454]